MNTRISCLLAILGAGGLAAVPAWADPGDHIMVTPADLEWTDVAALPPGAMMATIEGPMSEPAPFTVRLKLPPDYRIPPHWHPAVERVTVLSGAFYMGLGEQYDETAAMRLDPASIMIIQPGTRHFAWTGEAETTIQLHGTGPWGINYVNPADDPRSP